MVLYLLHVIYKDIFFQGGKNEQRYPQRKISKINCSGKFFLSCLFGLGILKAALLEEILSPQFALQGCFHGDEVAFAKG